ncbi:MAG: flavin reductase family protein [Flavobacteriales bacterium]|nr:flavin reductase family protein [Flavobacteriales bacterium]MCB9173344.1 flavin reductase family protein [Flavobacteriales bacterium]
MLSVNTSDLTTQKIHQYLLGAVGPRPIAFASTIDKNGNRNLSPFSFFNVFSAAPPILIFSPARSGRTGETKNTFDNVKEVAEVVINVVNYDIVQQMSLASSPFAKDVDEFTKSGLTPIASDLIKPFRVKESPVQFECKVNQIIELGQNGGAGNLIICEVLRIHINEDILSDDGLIDQKKIDLVSRMGGNWYCRADENSMFEVAKPLTTIGIGVDQIPEHIRTNPTLSGNELGLLASVEALPTQEEIKAYPKTTNDIYLEAKKLIEKGEILNAWKVLLG